MEVLKYYQKKGQHRVTPLPWLLMLLLSPLLFVNLSNSSMNKTKTTKEIAFADDITAAGKIKDHKCYWDEITTKGPNYGYYPKASKSHLIVKEKYINKARGAHNIKHINLWKLALRSYLSTDTRTKDRTRNFLIRSATAPQYIVS